jgi:hypothetical protein
MATRFTSYDLYKQMLADSEGNVTSKSTFLGTLDIPSLRSDPWKQRKRKFVGVLCFFLQFQEWSLTKCSWSLCWCH